jgi:nucleotide-binding universal stress UspA family protein
MNEIQSIVLATDFSSGARPAAARAAQLAGEHRASLSMLHVFEPDPFIALRDRVTSGNLQAKVEEQAKIALAALAHSMREQHAVAVETQLLAGSPLTELNHRARGADVMVLGAQGSHPVRQFALGSTAERLSRTAERPLLVVRNEPEAPYRRVLVAVDFSDASARALHVARRLAPSATFRLVHCYAVPFEGRLRMADVPHDEIEALRERTRALAKEQAAELLAQAGPEFGARVTTRRGDARLELLAEIDEWGADLVVVGKQGRSRMTDVLLGSVTSWLLRESSCDVLVVPANAAEP